MTTLSSGDTISHGKQQIIEHDITIKVILNYKSGYDM